MLIKYLSFLCWLALYGIVSEHTHTHTRFMAWSQNTHTHTQTHTHTHRLYGMVSEQEH